MIYGWYLSKVLNRCCLFLMTNVLNSQHLPLWFGGARGHSQYSLIKIFTCWSVFFTSLLKWKVYWNLRRSTCDTGVWAEMHLGSVDKQLINQLLVHKHLCCNCSCLRQLSSSFSARAQSYDTAAGAKGWAFAWTWLLVGHTPLEPISCSLEHRCSPQIRNYPKYKHFSTAQKSHYMTSQIW